MVRQKLVPHVPAHVSKSCDREGSGPNGCDQIFGVIVILRRFQGSQPHQGRSGVCKLGTRKHLVRHLELVRFLCAYPVVGNTCPLISHYETRQQTDICGVQFLIPKPPTSG